MLQSKEEIEDALDILEEQDNIKAMLEDKEALEEEDEILNQEDNTEDILNKETIENTLDDVLEEQVAEEEEEGFPEDVEEKEADEDEVLNKEEILEEEKQEDIFVEKIGTPSPFELSISLSGEDIDTLAFDQDVVTIGRDSECDVVIDNLGASRVHASIERIGKFVLLTDRESKTGTFIRGKKVEEYSLNSGDEFFLAKHTITFQKLTSTRWSSPSKGVASKTAGKKQQLMQTMAVDFRDLAKKQGPAPAYMNLMTLNRRLPINKNVMLFGKSENCDVNVGGFLIGDKHAMVVHEEKGFYLYHLGLFKAPKVNDQAIETALLESGDLVQIGDLKFIFQLNEE